MIELPHIFIQAVIYGVIVYAMIGFDWTVSKFLWYLLFMYLTFLYFTLYGMMTVAVTPNHNIAAIIASAFYVLWNLFSGFIIPRPVSYYHPFVLLFPFFLYSVDERKLQQFNQRGLSFFCNSGCRFGGDGTVGYAPSRGHCMDLLLPNLEM